MMTVPMPRRHISIVVPMLNEVGNIPALYDALVQEARRADPLTFEFIFVDDGSTDESMSYIMQLSLSDARIHALELSRNFGKEVAISAGIQYATGDAIIIMDADMQHPPSRIPDFLAEWERGSEVVIGVRERGNESLVRRSGSWIFHAVINRISKTRLELGETDFRLIDRVVADAFLKITERERMTRTLINWLGFKKAYVRFQAPPRRSGVPGYSTGKLIHLALYTFVTNSLTPLRIAGYLGLIITICSGLLGAVVLVNRFFLGDALGWNVSGTAQLAIVNVFLTGIMLMVLGVMSLYIGAISTEVARRPLFIIRRKINLA